MFQTLYMEISLHGVFLVAYTVTSYLYRVTCNLAELPTGNLAEQSTELS